ncbi:hypothetical protein ACLOJK_006743, partial [Asimina triloba]
MLSDDVFNADDVGRRRGLMWARHTDADITDVLDGGQLAAGERGGIVHCSWLMDVGMATTGGRHASMKACGGVVGGRMRTDGMVIGASSAAAGERRQRGGWPGSSNPGLSSDREGADD